MTQQTDEFYQQKAARYAKYLRDNAAAIFAGRQADAADKAKHGGSYPMVMHPDFEASFVEDIATGQRPLDDDLREMFDELTDDWE